MASDQGLRDSALLLIVLGEEAASEVFKRLTAKETQEIGETMARIRTTKQERVHEVLMRFGSDTQGHMSLIEDVETYIRGTLTRALGQERAGMLIDRSGLKGLTEGTATVSTEHANFLFVPEPKTGRATDTRTSAWAARWNTTSGALLAMRSVTSSSRTSRS
jgi:flagellar motor switch protein FliG